MPYIPLKKGSKIALIGLSIGLFVANFIRVVAMLGGPEKLKYVFERIGETIIYVPVSLTFNLGILEGLILMLTPYTIVSVLNRRYVGDIETRIPFFLRELAEGIRSGHSFMHAFEETSLRSVGALGKEMRRVVTRIFFGETLEETFSRLLKRIPSAKLRRFATIITVAAESGGRVADVLDTAARIMSLIDAFEKERKSKVKPYAITIYLSLFLFLVISFVLVEVFFKPLVGFRLLRGLVGKFNIRVYEAIFFYIGVMEAIFGGIIAGKITEGTIKASLLHILALLLMDYVLLGYVFPLLRTLIKIPLI